MVFNPALYEELEGSPVLTYTRGKGGTAKQMFRMPWEQVDDFLALIFPSPYISGTRIIIPPARIYPDKLWMVAKSTDIEPFDPMSPSGLFQAPNYYPGGAKVTVNYETPEFDQSNPTNDGPAGNDTVTFVTYKVSVGGEFLTYPSNSLRWDQPSDTTLVDSPGAPLSPRYLSVGDDTQAAVIIPLLEHTLTWTQVAFPPWRAIRTCLGKVNAYNFCGTPPETLLFMGCEASRDVTNQGIRCWNLEYKFAEKNQNPYNLNDPQGWNHFLRPDGLSAGLFMRMRKRLMGGFTTLRRPAAIGNATIAVMASSSFPRGASYKVLINNLGEHEVTAGFGTNVLTVDPVIAANYPVGATVAQFYRSTLDVAMTAGTNTVRIDPDDDTMFPRSGQFYLKIENEIVAVVAGQGTTTLTVLRGVSGTRAVPHAMGVNVDLTYGSVYDLADFNTLFLSGLVTG